ncbi:MAG: anti-sigma F factor [Ruminococcaceae bacterium]|nr:anti-sigma F factor [Oscillospiraceae bacterium]
MNTREKREINRMHLCLPSLSVNEGVARGAVSVFCAQADPAVTQLSDIKCAVSEAVTNCIVHAYRGTVGMIYITAILYADGVRVIVKDKGCGIADVRRAREPLYTTDAANERSGMGFTVMESFMDRLAVHSRPGKGTVVVMSKRFEKAAVKE